MSDPTFYTVAWICAIGTELVAAKQFLDQTHDDADQLPHNDDNTYILGNIARHNIVIAALPHGQYGLVSAAVVARDMVRSFPNLRFALMVGIGGGAPSKKNDIRLGDIVVSSPGSGMGGVLQYDFGKTVQDESFQITGHLNQSPQCLLRAIPFLQADYESDGNGIDEKIVHVLGKKPLLRKKYGKPDSSTDRLFNSTYKHAGDNDQECTAACVDTELIIRSTRSEEQDGPNIHFGLIASANQLMKDARIRDELSSEKGVLCFEMEAAGLMNQFPCLVVRGICDYSDTHKNKVWQGYAAMAAAAYAKDLLRKVAPGNIEKERRLTDVLSGVDSKLEDINSQVEATHTEIKSIQKDKHSDDIFRWLAPPDISSNLNKAIKTRHPGSGRRLLESKAYTTWKNGGNSFLWLYGIPGSGKTILASTIIEDLQKSQSPSQTLVYFYFDFTDSRKQSFENAFRSLVWQMYQQNEVARKHLDSLYSSAGRAQPSFDFLRKTFTEMMGTLEKVWIVLDALDECTPRGDLLAWLRSGNQDLSVQVNMHLLVTSRPEQDIESAIKHYASDDQMVAIRDDLLKADIRNYVQARVREHEGLSRWRGHRAIQDKIEAGLLGKANGMFRWVSCQLDALEDCLERKALLKALQDLPKTLHETYDRILANIPLEHVHHARRILQFLTYSERPLRLEEAVDAIVVDVGDNVPRGRQFDPEDRLPVPEEITRYCSSLVVLVSSPGRYAGAPTIREIQLAHFSVKDYLTSDHLESRSASYLQEMSAKSSIAEVCLAYLLELEQVADGIEQDFPFAQYSAQYWWRYAVVGESRSEYVFRLSMELLSNDNQLKSWIRQYDPDDDPDDDLDDDLMDEFRNYDIPSALYYASLIGMPRCVAVLLDNGADVNARGGYYGNALYAALSKGHREIAQLLLDYGADVNVQGGRYGNALQGASYKGHQSIARLLLDYGAVVNIQGGRYGNALQGASYKGHQNIARLLLDNGANINAQGGLYGNALQAASSGGHQEFVQLLLDYGADVNIQGGCYGNALQGASYKGHQNIARLLLDNGANINAQGGLYGNALQAASSGGHQEFVQLLLDYRTDVNAQGGHYGNALQAALHKGHQGTVQLLLDHGADVNAQGGYYGNALLAALDKGHQGTVQLLLDHGADVNAQGGYYGNALRAASIGGHQEIVELLLRFKTEQDAVKFEQPMPVSSVVHSEQHTSYEEEDTHSNKRECIDDSRGSVTKKLCLRK